MPSFSAGRRPWGWRPVARAHGGHTGPTPAASQLAVFLCGRHSCALRAWGAFACRSAQVKEAGRPQASVPSGRVKSAAVVAAGDCMVAHCRLCRARRLPCVMTTGAGCAAVVPCCSRARRGQITCIIISGWTERSPPRSRNTALSLNFREVEAWPPLMRLCFERETHAC